MLGKTQQRWNTSVGSCPCDTCEHKERCDDLDLACRDYAEYSYSNQYRNEDRNPTRKQYLAIYGTRDD